MRPLGRDGARGLGAGPMDPVMVPVPAELVDDVRRHVNMLAARAASGDWSDESVGRLYDRLDEDARAVLKMVARNVADGEPASVAAIADATGIGARQVRGIVVEITHLHHAVGGPQMSLLLLDPPEGPDPQADHDDDQRPVLMPVAGAHMVLAVAHRR